MTTQWGYGDPNTPTTFNNPAFTVEAIKGTETSVRWINELLADPVACRASATPATDPACNFLEHVVKDQNGLGVPVDYVKSYAWNDLAAARGDEPARVNIRFLEENMTPAQIADGRKLSGELCAKIPKCVQ